MVRLPYLTNYPLKKFLIAQKLEITRTEKNRLFIPEGDSLQGFVIG